MLYFGFEDRCFWTPTFCAIHPRLINIKVLLHTIDKDVGNIQPKVKKLADDGFIKFEDGPKNSKIPYLTYDEIKLEI